MTGYILSRLLLLPLTVFGVSIIIFTVMRVLPGDVVDAVAGEETSLSPQQRDEIRQELGLDRPLPAQYWEWASGIARLDFGDSLLSGDSITDDLLTRLPVTLQLAFMAMLVSAVAGISSGVASVLFPRTPLDYLCRISSLLGLAVPLFFLASFVRNFILPRYFHWLPPPGYADLWEDPVMNLQQLWLPALVLGLVLSAIVSRMMRSTMLDVLGEDYIRTAKAKGLRFRTVVVRHAMPNALIPVLTLLGIQTAALLGGSVIIENIFGLPGIGRYLVDAIARRDYPVVQAGVMVSAFVYLLVNLAVDVLNARLDPRVAVGASK